MTSRRSVVLGVLLAMILVLPSVLADTEAQVSAARAYFGDVTLVDQAGQSVRLYDDLIQGHVVVIGTFFTTCTGACPPLMQKLLAIQREFIDHMGRDLRIMSISVDPTHDTPPRLKEYAQRLGAGPGWYLLTGDETVTALKKLGQYVKEPINHSNVVLIGNERTGLWKKAFGFAKTDELFRLVDEVINDPGEN